MMVALSLPRATLGNYSFTKSHSRVTATRRFIVTVWTLSNERRPKLNAVGLLNYLNTSFCLSVGEVGLNLCREPLSAKSCNRDHAVICRRRCHVAKLCRATAAWLSANSAFVECDPFAEYYSRQYPVFTEMRLPRGTLGVCEFIECL